MSAASEIAAAVGFALALWWVGTGGILVAVGLSRRTLGWVSAATLPLLALAVVGFDYVASREETWAVYAGFAAAVAVWGWHEFAFLTGAITGPRRAPCPDDAPEWTRFRCAVAALAWHELALAATALALAGLTWGAPNQVGLWTFLTLFFARISAKLNVFLGVPNLAAEFIPDALAHLKSYFRFRPMNLLFPVSVTGLTVAAGWWVEHTLSAGDPTALAGAALLATLTILALIEHWFLVLPLRDAALWHWMLPAEDARRRSPADTDRERSRRAAAALKHPAE